MCVAVCGDTKRAKEKRREREKERNERKKGRLLIKLCMQWVKRVKEASKKLPIILVALRVELRATAKPTAVVTTEQVRSLLSLFSAFSLSLSLFSHSSLTCPSSSLPTFLRAELSSVISTLPLSTKFPLMILLL